jgi:hypothetical protein
MGDGDGQAAVEVGRYLIDVERPPMPKWTILPPRWVVERTFA